MIIYVYNIEMSDVDITCILLLLDITIIGSSSDGNLNVCFFNKTY